MRGYLNAPDFVGCDSSVRVLDQIGTFTSRNIALPPGETIKNISIAGNERVCILSTPLQILLDAPESTYVQNVHICTNLDSFLNGTPPLETYSIEKDVASVVASSSTFTILTTSGQILTFGDGRFPSLLGRTTSIESPAASPTIVSALDGIKIKKVVAGSWCVAALSNEKDFYIWGHSVPQPLKEDHVGLSTLLDSVNEDGEAEDVHLIDVANGADVEDVAVGDDHIVVLTTEGEVWGFGSNEYGQLGLGKDVKGTLGKWVKCFDEEKRGKAVEMSAAPFATILS